MWLNLKKMMLWYSSIFNKIKKSFDKPYHLVALTSVAGCNTSQEYWEDIQEELNLKHKSFISQVYHNLEQVWLGGSNDIGTGPDGYKAYTASLLFLLTFFIAIFMVSVAGPKKKDKESEKMRLLSLDFLSFVISSLLMAMSLMASWSVYCSLNNLKTSTINRVYLRSNWYRDFQIRKSTLLKYREIWHDDESNFLDNISYSVSRLGFNKLIIVDQFTLVMQGFLFFCSFLFFLAFTREILVRKKNNLNIKGNLDNFYLNFLIVSSLAIFFLSALISSYDLLSLFVSLEGATLCLYVLAGLRSSQRLSVESGLKYFLTSAVFSCIFGLGAFLVYFLTGSTNFYIIREVIGNVFNSPNFFNSFYNVDYLLIFSVFLIVVVFLMKLGAVPYHFWIGDVYQGAPLFVTAFFATIVRISFFAIFFRLIVHLFFFMGSSEFFMSLLYYSGCASIIIGSFLALSQFELKRFLAYSSIVHTGFILIGLSTMDIAGFKSALLYVVVYIFTLLCFFMVLFLFPVSFVQNQNGVVVLKNYKIRQFSDFQNLPMSVQLYFIFFLFSMAGLPPFPGFIIKLYVFKEYLSNLIIDVISHHYSYNFIHFFSYTNFYMYIVIILISLITAYGYTRLITRMSFADVKSSDFDKFLFRNRSKGSNNFNQKFIILVIILMNLILICKLPYIYESDFMNSVVYSCYHPFFNKESLAIEYLITQDSDSPINSLELWFRALPYDAELNPHLDDKFIKNVRWASSSKYNFELTSFKAFN